MSDHPSTKPYLIRAIHEWCTDNGFRPYIAVAVDESTEVPMEFVRGGEIVLNVSAEATHRLVIGNDRIEFEARFNRVARQVSVPVASVTAIYAAENGHGMAFEVAKAPAQPRPARAAPQLRAADAPPPREPVPATPAAADPATDPDTPQEAPRADGATADAASVAEPPRAPRRRSRARKADAAASPMALVPLPSAALSAEPPSEGAPPEAPRDPVPPPAGGRPRLTRVK